MHAHAHVFIFVNGILSDPGAHDGWTDRAVSWVHRNTVHQAEKFEYHSRALTRRLRQQLHANALRALLRGYSDRIIHLAGHSNGSDIILRALDGLFMRVATVHLISGACEASFTKNKLNGALLDARIGQVYVYVAGSDRAMRWARLSQRLFGWLGLGYGTLGLAGPLEVDPALQDMVRRGVVTIWEREFGHSTWFDKDHFETTMRRITTHHA